MNLTINGETQSSSAETLGALVEQLGMKPDRVAIELNREIVPRDQWPQAPLHDGDRLEIVHFVGGGSGYARLSASTPINIDCHPERSEGSVVRRNRQTRRKFGNPFPDLLT
jgi:thiamine biosynthesis protein ThiS